MRREEKLKSYLAQAEALGINRWQAAPPLHRLAWRLGIPLAPPLCMSFAGLTLLFGGMFGLAMYFVLNAPYWSPIESPMATVVGAIVGGVLYGLAMAAVFKSQQRNSRFPLWRGFQ
ncbi:DUF6404 family protein [Pseudoxanthomonas daejeonensis]|nr:DUF6404 family protein [Pseudoxanthomonas daejeonensis]